MTNNQQTKNQLRLPTTEHQTKDTAKVYKFNAEGEHKHQANEAPTTKIKIRKSNDHFTEKNDKQASQEQKSYIENSSMRENGSSTNGLLLLMVLLKIWITRTPITTWIATELLAKAVQWPVIIDKNAASLETEESSGNVATELLGETIMPM